MHDQEHGDQLREKDRIGGPEPRTECKFNQHFPQEKSGENDRAHDHCQQRLHAKDNLAELGFDLICPNSCQVWVDHHLDHLPAGHCNLGHAFCQVVKARRFCAVCQRADNQGVGFVSNGAKCAGGVCREGEAQETGEVLQQVADASPYWRRRALPGQLAEGDEVVEQSIDHLRYRPHPDKGHEAASRPIEDCGKEQAQEACQENDVGHRPEHPRHSHDRRRHAAKIKGNRDGIDRDKGGHFRWEIEEAGENEPGNYR